MTSCGDWNRKNPPPRPRVLTNDPAKQLDEAFTLYNAYRAYIRIEHELENERSTWHNVLQGFLFATLGVMGQWQSTKDFPNSLSAERHALPFLLAFTGIAVALLVLRSIRAAENAIDELCKRWEDVAKHQIDPPIRGLLPAIRGGGHETAHHHGAFAARWIPLIIIGAWVGVFFMFGYDVLRQPSQSAQPTATSTQPAEVHPCAQAVPSSQTPTQQELMSEIVCSQESSTLYRQQLKVRYGIEFPANVEMSAVKAGRSRKRRARAHTPAPQKP